MIWSHTDQRNKINVTVNYIVLGSQKFSKKNVNVWQAVYIIEARTAMCIHIALW